MTEVRYYQSDLTTNALPAHFIAEVAVRVLEDAGQSNEDWGYIVERAGRGWCAAEIARGYVRTHYRKGDIRRRRLLTALTRLGARQMRVRVRNGLGEWIA